MEKVLEEKFDRLITLLREMQSVVLAFSGGVDSTLLLTALKTSGIPAMAVTIFSEVVSRSDIRDAEEILEKSNIRSRILPLKVLTPDFVKNTQDRCFFCKSIMFEKLDEAAKSGGYHLVIDGSNTDDLRDYRPGSRAAAEHGVRSPLLEAGLFKEEIRELSRKLALPDWDKESSSCLATRIPYGSRITIEALRRIDSAEEYLRSLGLRTLRLRDHGDVARIETGEEEIGLILSERKLICATLKSLGYAFVSVDLEGFVPGSMNRILGNS